MKPQALVLCGDTWHPAEIVRQGLDAFDGDFDFEFLEDGATLSVERMSNFPLTILAKANIASSQIDHPWLHNETGEAFATHIRRGNGLAVIHAGTARYEKLPAMNGLLGGAFASHPEQCEVTIEPVPGHALTTDAVPFTVHDEHYFMTPISGDAEVFLHSRSVHGVQPAGWTRNEGAGRVCVLTPGHNLEVWLHPLFQKLLLNALRWTAK